MKLKRKYRRSNRLNLPMFIDVFNSTVIFIMSVHFLEAIVLKLTVYAAKHDFKKNVFHIIFFFFLKRYSNVLFRIVSNKRKFNKSWSLIFVLDYSFVELRDNKDFSTSGGLYHIEKKSMDWFLYDKDLCHK